MTTATTKKTKKPNFLKSAGLAAGVSVWTLFIGGGLLTTLHYYEHCSITVKPTCRLGTVKL